MILNFGLWQCIHHQGLSPLRLTQFKRNVHQLRLVPGLTLLTNDGPLGSHRTDVRVRRGDLKLLGAVRHKRSQRSSLTGTPPPLCLLGDWLWARKSDMMKYAEIYLDQKFDVLILTSRMDHIFYPSHAVAHCENILEFLHSNTEYKQMIWHGFAHHSYFWSIMMLLMEERGSSCRTDIYRRIIGQIWDSPCGPDSVARGVALSLFGDRRFLRIGARLAIRQYMKLRDETLDEAFKGAFAKFKSNKLTCPALIFCSENDVMSNPEKVQEMTKRWIGRSHVKIKSWNKSGHCAHLRDHPGEYKEELAEYLESIGLLKYPHLLGPSLSAPP